MKYTVSVSFDTAEEAAKFLTGGKAAGTKKKSTKDEDADDLLGGAEEEGDDLLGGEDDEVTEEMVAEKVKDLCKEGHKAKVVALLKRAKVDGVSKLKPEKLKPFMDTLLKIK